MFSHDFPGTAIPGLPAEIFCDHIATDIIQSGDLSSIYVLLRTSSTMRNAVLAKLAQPHLLIQLISQLDRAQIAGLLQTYFLPGSENYQALERQATNPDNHAAFICYALVTDNVMALDRARLISALNWLSPQTQYAFVYQSLYLIGEIVHGLSATRVGQVRRGTIQGINAHDKVYINLSGVKLSAWHIDNSNLCYANLYKADFSAGVIKQTRLHRARLEGAKLDVATISEVDLSEANMRKASLFFTNFSRSNLGDADLSGASHEEATFYCSTTKGAKFIEDYSHRFFSQPTSITDPSVDEGDEVEERPLKRRRLD